MSEELKQQLLNLDMEREKIVTSIEIEKLKNESEERNKNRIKKEPTYKLQDLMVKEIF